MGTPSVLWEGEAFAPASIRVKSPANILVVHEHLLHAARSGSGVRLIQVFAELRAQKRKTAQIRCIFEGSAGVAELADAQDLGSCGLKTVEVQILSPAPGESDS